MGSAPTPLVFIHVGSEPVHHLHQSLAYAARFAGDVPILVCLGASHPAAGRIRADPRCRLVAIEELPLGSAYREFDRLSPLERTAHGGVVHKAAERFFLLAALMDHLGLDRAFHAENDNLIFFGLAEMEARLAPLYPGLAATFDADDRCIPGVVYIGAASALAEFNAFVLARLGEATASEAPTDMRLLSDFRHAVPRSVIDALPIAPTGYPRPFGSTQSPHPADPGLFTRNVEAIGWVFDAAAIGQYLYGTRQHDPGFINETACVDPSAFANGFAPDAAGRLAPWIEVAGRSWPLANLHLHCKLDIAPRPGPFIPKPLNPWSRWRRRALRRA
jgi:hypothetical protein